MELWLRLSTLKGILEARERARAKYGSVPQGGLALTREMLPTYLCGPAASLSCVQPLRLLVSQALRARDGDLSGMYETTECLSMPEDGDECIDCRSGAQCL